MSPFACLTAGQIVVSFRLVDTMLSLHKRLATEQLPARREQAVKKMGREIDATGRSTSSSTNSTA